MKINSIYSLGQNQVRMVRGTVDRIPCLLSPIICLLEKEVRPGIDEDPLRVFPLERCIEALCPCHGVKVLALPLHVPIRITVSTAWAYPPAAVPEAMGCRAPLDAAAFTHRLSPILTF